MFPADKFNTIEVTPDGSIIHYGDKEAKPETDPGWAEREAQRKAKAKRRRPPSPASE